MRYSETYKACFIKPAVSHSYSCPKHKKRLGSVRCKVSFYRFIIARFMATSAGDLQRKKKKERERAACETDKNKPGSV